MKTKPRRIGLLLGTGALLLAGLACRTLLGDPDAIEPQPETLQAAQASPTLAQAATPTTSALNAPGPSSRLTGEDLPALAFGLPGESPYDDGRPELSGSPVTLDTEHFRIHYTQTGQDAVPPADGDGNGHPDYVEEVARALEYAWFAEIEHFGWAAPPPDEGLGGDDRYDVYLVEIFDEGTAGYVDSDYYDGFFGDNPNTAVVERRSSSSHMALDNDYDGYNASPVPGASLLDYMRSTVAHEFAHSIQYGYDSEEPHDWLWEATATWMQDEVFDLVNDGNEVLPSVFKSPDSCQLAYGGDERVEDEDHWYGMWIFLRYVSERYGHSAIRAVWEQAVTRNGYDAWEEALEHYGTDLGSLFQEFAVALLLRSFDEGDTYPIVRLEGRLEKVDQPYEPLDGVAPMGLDYIEITPRQPVRIAVNGDDMTGRLVAVLDGHAQVFSLVGGRAAIDVARFDRVYLLVINLRQASAERSCAVSDYSVSLTAATETDQPVQELAAPNFLPPRVEGLREWDQ